jgi:opacity protein-like surface antigen
VARGVRLASALIAALALCGNAYAESAQELEDQILARDDRIEALEQKLDTVIEELARVRTQVAVPDEPELKSVYGLGPAASKIYGVERGLSIGGYGEGFYRNFIGDAGSGSDSVGGLSISDRQLDRADFLRLVVYLGYKFTDRIIFNSEIEFEHAKTGSSSASAGSGSVSVEFASLDFLWKQKINARAGLLLLPMGFVNEIHEPPFFNGVQRPETELRIIPSTWRENGAGIFGRLSETLEYRAYVVTGFNARGFSDAGVRGGRQNGNRALAEDLAIVARLDWTPTPELLLGGSFYRGGSGQNQELDGVDIPDADLTIFEVHGQYRRGPLEARGLFAISSLSDARDLNLALGRPSNRPIADKMLGGYAEVAYDIWPMLFDNSEKRLTPFLRIEYVDTQYEVPSGFTPNRRNSYWLYTPGISFKPHPNVVLKLEYRNFDTRGGDRPDELSIGMGFAF